MIKELDNFIIESSVEISYFDDIVRFILKNEKDALEFFGLRELPKKFNIKIMSYEEFKNEEIKRFGEVKDYIRGITDGLNNTIMILSVEDQIKYTTHKTSTLEDTLKMILHEIIHACNSAINNDFFKTIWFKEGLATNLAKQNYSLMDLSMCNFELLKNDFNNYGKNKYAYAYTIVNYVLNNYDKETIMKLITDSNYLRNNSNKLFEEAKNYTQNNNNYHLTR